MYIARGDVLIDTIPLHEIMSVEEMNDDPESARNHNNPQGMISKSSSERHLVSSESVSNRSQSTDKDPQKKNTKSSRQSVLQVKTILDGYNFGRIYYLRQSIGSSSTHIVKQLLVAVRTAISVVERKSRFQKSQDMVKGFQDSFGFQVMVAILIMLVSKPRRRALTSA